jgi:hypothetical protein
MKNMLTDFNKSERLKTDAVFATELSSSWVGIRHNTTPFRPQKVKYEQRESLDSPYYNGSF